MSTLATPLDRSRGGVGLTNRPTQTGFWQSGHTPTLIAAFLYFDVSFMVWLMLGPLNLPQIRNIPLLAVGPAGLDLTMVWNYGVTFGLLRGENLATQLVLALAAAAIALFLLRWMARAETRWVAGALGAVIGGAVGNVIDRLRFGAVVDFLDFHWSVYHWPAFNVADSAITIGVLFLITDGLFRRSEGSKKTAAR